MVSENERKKYKKVNNMNEQQNNTINPQTPQIAPSSMPPAIPNKKAEFEAFLQEIGKGNLPQWNIIAEALSVSPETITRWKNHPLAKQAICSAIEDNINKMKEAGAKDWKMYRELLKMLGVKDKQTLEHEGIESVSDILDKLECKDGYEEYQTDYGKLATDYGKLADEAKKSLLSKTQTEPLPVSLNPSQV